MGNEEKDKIPVTVVTGFLGAGKTTLVNYILKENHGWKIAVIENEFGEIGIDEQLVSKKVQADEELFSMDNGCLCCTVRGDLVRTLTQIVGGKTKFDAIMVETTGLADPAPIAQTFFATPELQDALRLDAILCVVDSKHVQMHLDDKKDEGTTNEAVEQIAFADKILLNKIDLVTPEEKSAVRRRIKHINAACEIIETQQSRVSLDKLLGLDVFNLKRVLEMMPTFLSGAADPDAHDPTCEDPHCGHDDHCHDDGCKDPHHHHGHDHKHEHDHCHDKECKDPHHHHDHDHKHEHKHGEEEQSKKQKHEHGHGHHHGAGHKHDDKVTSVGITCPGDLDGAKLNRWMSELLGAKGDDLFRTKGVLAVHGQDEKMIFQGVHTQMTMATSSQIGCPGWLPGEERKSQMVFIGRHLVREDLQKNFNECAWDPANPFVPEEEEEEEEEEPYGDEED